MAKQFLDATGLRHLWEKINSKFFPKEGNVTAPGNRSKIRLIPSSNTLNYNIVFRDLNDTVDLLDIGTNGDTGQDSSFGQIILNNKTQTSALVITSGGLSLTYNSSPTKVFATNGSVVDMNTYIDEAITTSELNGVLV